MDVCTCITLGCLAAPARGSVEMSTRFSNLKVGIRTLFFPPFTSKRIRYNAPGTLPADMDAIVKDIRVAPIDGTT